jgi:hypothetical protein
LPTDEKAESELGKRLHIDKTMLRTWREDFAQLMREQGIAANATPRAVRGRNKRRNADPIFHTHRRRGASTAVRERVNAVARELGKSGIIADPVQRKLLKTREAIAGNWLQAADVLDAQGEAILAAQVREFARNLPPALTDKQQLASNLLRFTRKSSSPQPSNEPPQRDRGSEFTR